MVLNELREDGIQSIGGATCRNRSRPDRGRQKGAGARQRQWEQVGMSFQLFLFTQLNRMEELRLN